MKKNKLKGFGRRLRLARVDAGISIGELARRSDVARPAISRIENGHMLPSLPLFARILKEVGCEADELLVLERRVERQAS